MTLGEFVQSLTTFIKVNVSAPESGRNRPRSPSCTPCVIDRANRNGVVIIYGEVFAVLKLVNCFWGIGVL